MNSKDKEIMNGFIKVRNLNKRTVYGYNNVIKLYTNFNNMSLSELLKEAEKDEEKGIRWKNRKIKMRLLNFRVFLQNNYLISTAKVHFQRILTIYRHFEIEIHNLPQINLKNANKLKPIMFEDLPTKEIIKDAINITNPIMQAIILFISSSESMLILNILARLYNISDVGTDLSVSILDRLFLLIFNILANLSCDMLLLFLKFLIFSPNVILSLLKLSLL